MTTGRRGSRAKPTTGSGVNPSSSTSPKAERGKTAPAKPTFAATLTRLRTDAGLTVAELATKAGMNRESVRLYESGKRQPTWKAVQKIADALAAPLEAFRDI